MLRLQWSLLCLLTRTRISLSETQISGHDLKAQKLSSYASRMKELKYMAKAVLHTAVTLFLGGSTDQSCFFSTSCLVELLPLNWQGH